MKKRIIVRAYDVDNSIVVLQKSYFAKDGDDAIQKFESEFKNKVESLMIIAESKELIK